MYAFNKGHLNSYTCGIDHWPHHHMRRYFQNFVGGQIKQSQCFHLGVGL